LFKKGKMNKSPKISVVMPVYNGEKFLKEAIESILKQTYKDFEFLIIYDKSTDNTLSIIQESQKQDERIILINGDKEGISGALNIGINKARGKYIARMDADDISLPTRFEVQINHMENLGLDICGGHSLLIDSDGKVNGIGLVPRSHDLCGLSMMFMVPFAHSSVMILKSFLTDYSLRYIGKYEDFDLWARMFSSGAKFGNVDDVVLQYRVLKNSLSVVHAKGARRYNRGVLKIFRTKHHKFISEIVKHLDIRLLSEGEKSLVVRYTVNMALTRLDFFGLYKLKDIALKIIVITALSEIQRISTKYAWWSVAK
jgi:glycosyltransferase involved in cell wall biosynthesis